MSAPHTAGPWIADLHRPRQSAGRTYAAIWSDACKAAVPIGAVTLGVEGMPDDEGRANARLIAAAPELREALVVARKQLATAVIANSGGMFDHDTVGEHVGVAQIDAALAKAEGR